MDKRTYFFGVYDRSGGLIMRIGARVKCTYKQAAAVCLILEAALNKTLEPGDYIACDYEGRD